MPTAAKRESGELLARPVCGRVLTPTDTLAPPRDIMVMCLTLMSHFAPTFRRCLAGYITAAANAIIPLPFSRIRASATTGTGIIFNQALEPLMFATAGTPLWRASENHSAC